MATENFEQRYSGWLKRPSSLSSLLPETIDGGRLRGKVGLGGRSKGVGSLEECGILPNFNLKSKISIF